MIVPPRGRIREESATQPLIPMPATPAPAARFASPELAAKEAAERAARAAVSPEALAKLRKQKEQRALQAVQEEEDRKADEKFVVDSVARLTKEREEVVFYRVEHLNAITTFIQALASLPNIMAGAFEDVRSRDQEITRLNAFLPGKVKVATVQARHTAALAQLREVLAASLPQGPAGVALVRLVRQLFEGQPVPRKVAPVVESAEAKEARVNAALLFRSESEELGSIEAGRRLQQRAAELAAKRGR